MRHLILPLMLALTSCSSPSFDIEVGDTDTFEVSPLGPIEVDPPIKYRPEPDAARDVLPDAPLPNGSVECSAKEACSTPSATCCVQSGIAMCEPSATCPMNKSYACDDASDCPMGQQCFLMSAGGSRCGTSGDFMLCASNDDCPSKQCVFYSGSPLLRKCVP